ncbi:MAG: hotdog fold thioesterase [Flavobacteriales bacterium]|nr:hotdog fold thioesterase [Flavobacteriales bacterium]
MSFEVESLLKRLNEMNKNTLMETLGIEFIEVSQDSLKAKMPVNSRVHQPYGILHGGASVVLAETVGSVLSSINVDNDKYNVLGLQITANHLKPVKDGYVYATGTFIKKGRTTHVVQIQLENEEQKPTCVCTLTNFIQQKK